MATKTNIDAKTVGAAAALTAAAAAAAAGAYWLYGAKDASKHRKVAKSWMLKARAEVMEAVEKLSDVDKAKYLAIVEEVARRYGSKAGVGTAEVARLAKDLKSSWNFINQQQKASKAPAKRRPAAKKKAKKAKQ